MITNPIKTNRYSGLSIVLHWIATFSVVALFVSHEASSNSGMAAFHVGGGAILGVLLLWRVLRHPVRGFANKPDQPVLLNLISTLVMWGLLISIFVVVVTGYLIPWTQGQPLEIYSVISIPSFMSESVGLHDLIEELHDISGHVIVPLVLLHVLGAFKHFIFDRDGIMQRMFKAEKGGR